MLTYSSAGDESHRSNVQFCFERSVSSLDYWKFLLVRKVCIRDVNCLDILLDSKDLRVEVRNRYRVASNSDVVHCWTITIGSQRSGSIMRPSLTIKSTRALDRDSVFCFSCKTQRRASESNDKYSEHDGPVRAWPSCKRYAVQSHKLRNSDMCFS